MVDAVATVAINDVIALELGRTRIVVIVPTVGHGLVTAGDHASLTIIVIVVCVR